MPRQDVLVAAEHRDGVAAVLREEDGSLWLTGYLSHGGGTCLDDYAPRAEGLTGERAVQGGRLPPGAVEAIVIGLRGEELQPAVRNGAWLIVLDQPVESAIWPVRFLDAEGRVVAPPLPASWERTPVTDAEEPCPACGATTWDKVIPNDDSRGMRGSEAGSMSPSPIVVCRRCGHEERVGTWIRAEADEDEDPEEIAHRVRAFERRIHEQKLQAIESVTFPVFAPKGYGAELRGWGGVAGVSHVELSSTDPAGRACLTIETRLDRERFRSTEALARRAFEHVLHDEIDDWPHRSEPGMAIWMSAQEREREGRTALALRSKRRIHVSGAPVEFSVVSEGRRWGAAARLDELNITISVRGLKVGDVELVEVADLRSLVPP
jgi:hypothetical protein